MEISTVKDLTERIMEELGEKALQLPDIFLDTDFGRHASAILPMSMEDIISLDFALVRQIDAQIDRALLGKIQFLYDSLSKEYLKRKRQGTIEAMPLPTQFALRLLDHDTRDINTALFGFLDLIDRRKPHIIGKIIPLLAASRSYALTMAYLAFNGNDQFLYDIPAEYLPFLLNRKPTATIMPKTSPQIVTSAEFVALSQLAKNARGNYTLYVGSNEGYITLAVKDKGTGILDEKDKPLPKERLHEIFSDFSTNGGGLGLQVVNALAELRRGYVEVVSTTEGNPTLSYNTRDNKAVLKTPREEVGATFTLYIPK